MSSITNIQERLSQRIQEAQKEAEKPKNIPNKLVKKQPTKTSLKETDVGITEFMSNLPGFHAVIKQRYSDFCVHEIDKQGNIIILDNYDLPDETDSKPSEEAISLLGVDVIAKLDRMVEDELPEPVEIDVTSKTRDERKEIHKFVKDKYGTAVASNTADKDDKKFISVLLQAGKKADNRRPGHLPKYLQFVLFKSNMDFSLACNLLAKKLNLKPNNFHVAGTKDKRAITTQRVTVKNIYAKQLHNVKEWRNMSVGNFEYKDYALSLGDLKGNNFEIALRDVTASDEEISTAMETLTTRGFLHYFGLQRFGSYIDSPTHEVGKLLVKEQFGQALELLMKPRGDQDRPDMRSARDIYAKTRDAGQALSALRNKRCIEGQLLFALKKNGPNAYVNAFDAVPRNLRLLYLHAFQSIIWNKVLSLRIAKHGTAVLEGDLVFIDDKAKEMEQEIIIEEGESIEVSAVSADTEEAKLEKPCPVRWLTADEVSKYTIYDIVLTIPGHSAVYPKNDTFEMYKEVLAADGITTESFGSRVRKYSLYGAYREIAKKPKNLSWKIVRYENPEDDLILSDVEILEGKKLPEEKGNRKAIVLKMDLGRSTYATMALREILRSDTSWSTQASMNNKREAPPPTGDEETEERNDNISGARESDQVPAKRRREENGE